MPRSPGWDVVFSRNHTDPKRSGRLAAVQLRAGRCMAKTLPPAAGVEQLEEPGQKLRKNCEEGAGGCWADTDRTRKHRAQKTENNNRPATDIRHRRPPKDDMFGCGCGVVSVEAEASERKVEKAWVDVGLKLSIEFRKTIA